MDSETLAKKRNVKILITISILIFLSIIGYAIYTLVGRIGKIAVTVKYAPYIAEVTTNDNQKLKNNSVNYLLPGEYTIKVSYDGFEPLEETVNITDDTINVYGMLNPSSSEGEQLAEKYQNDFLDVQGLYGQASIAEGEQQRETWPLLNALPITNILYSLGYILDTNNNLTITVRTTEPYLDSVIEKLISLAEAPQTIANYNVRINDFANALANRFINNTNTDPSAYLITGYANVDELTVNPGYTSGECYYTTISVGNEDDYTLVTYRVVLRQSENSWTIVGTPYPIATTYNTPNVPLDILNAVNSL